MLRVLLAMLAFAMMAWAAANPAAAQTGPTYALAPLPPLKPVIACVALAKTDLAAATGAPTTLATRDVTGTHSYCEVTGTIAPAIRFAVRLPLAGWTQRLLQTGCGGLCGNLHIELHDADRCTPATDGSLVLAGTDMGHQGMGGGFGKDSQAREDFAWRGVHLTALAAKALIAAFYGQPARFSYFSGCSDGGREALMEAQRFPQDFDGIAAGAPALNFAAQNSFHHAWLANANTGADGHAIITAIDTLPLHAAVLKACDGLDGLVDGQITDPRQCRFDPAVIACGGAYQPGQCLTADQVTAVRRIYAGAHSANGTPLEAGPIQPGSELQWVGVFVPFDRNGPVMSRLFALDTINGLLFTPNPATPYTTQTFPFTEDMASAEAPARALYNADNPDLSGFAAHGGKLILYHGWSDPHISPINTIQYYEATGSKLGIKTRDAFVRLFVLPGMGHCGGGDGPSDFPLLAAIMAWVETGQTPDVVIARRVAEEPHGPPPGAMGPPPGAMGPPPGAMGPPPGMAPAPLVPRSRPIFAWPQVARYSGSGSIDEAASFIAR